MPFHPDRPSRPRRPCSQVEPAQPSHTPGAPIDGPLLYTPGEAAQLLKVRESWLRKKAAARQVPCTFLGKHLRFSPTDLAAIVAGAAQPPTGHRRSRPTTTRDRDLIRPPDRSVDPPQPDDHNHREGSTTWRG